MRFSPVFAVVLFAAGCGTATPRYAASEPSYADAVVVTASDGDLARARPEGMADADRQFVRNATLALDVGSDDEVPTVLEQAGAMTRAMGGYVSWEGPGQAVLRVPDARLDEALDRLGTLGDVERREIRVQDVTAEYTDLQLRLDNARALQTRLRALLDDAETVSDVIAVETELARVTTDVERLEGQLRQLQNQVAFSTVRLRVYDGATPGPLGWVVVGLYEAVKWLFVWD